MAIALLLGIPILSLLFGYFLWKSAIDNYGYNVYGTGVLIRLAIAGLACFLDPIIGLGFFIIFSIWNFIATWKNTSFFIAFFAVLFQPIALWFAISAINRVLRAIND